MKPSENAYNLSKAYEGLRLVAYPDPGTGGEPWTIGYGSTHNVKRGMKISVDEANARLIEDTIEAADSVNRWVKVPLNQNQFDALVDFVFNVGETKFKTSSLLRILNGGGYASAALEFGRWVYAAGKRLPGLVKRREAERELFQRPMP